MNAQGPYDDTKIAVPTAQIRELTALEVEEVAGGALPLIIVAVIVVGVVMDEIQDEMEGDDSGGDDSGSGDGN